MGIFGKSFSQKVQEAVAALASRIAVSATFGPRSWEGRHARRAGRQPGR